MLTLNFYPTTQIDLNDSRFDTGYFVSKVNLKSTVKFIKTLYYCDVFIPFMNSHYFSLVIYGYMVLSL